MFETPGLEDEKSLLRSLNFSFSNFRKLAFNEDDDDHDEETFFCSSVHFKTLIQFAFGGET